MRRRLMCSVALLTFALAERPALADSIVITPNSEVRFDYEGDWFLLKGAGFSAQTSLDTWGFNIPRIQPASCVTCAAGDTLNPGFQTPGEVDLWHGSATVGDTLYSDVTFRGSLDVDVQPISFPAMTDLYYMPELPFTFAGFLRGFSGGQEVFASALTGTGTTWQVFFRLDDGRYQDEYGNRGFVFADAGSPAPVPEPATLVLFGTGIAGVVVRARHRLARARDTN